MRLQPNVRPPLPISEARVVSVAAGTSISTTRVRLVIPAKTNLLSIAARTFTTAVVAQIQALPYLQILKSQDALVTFTDYSSAAQDGSDTTDVDLSAQDTIANGDYIFVGSHVPFAGLWADVDAANAVASVMSVEYWNGSAFADITPTDGTDSGGATLAVDGQVTWTVPTAWTKTRLSSALGLAPQAVGRNAAVDMNAYWVQIGFDAALTNPTRLNALLAIARYEFTLGENVVTEMLVKKGPGGLAGLSAVTNAGTGVLDVNAFTLGDTNFG